MRIPSAGESEVSRSFLTLPATYIDLSEIENSAVGNGVLQERVVHTHGTALHMSAGGLP